MAALSYCCSRTLPALGFPASTRPYPRPCNLPCHPWPSKNSLHGRPPLVVFVGRIQKMRAQPAQRRELSHPSALCAPNTPARLTVSGCPTLQPRRMAGAAAGGSQPASTSWPALTAAAAATVPLWQPGWRVSHAMHAMRIKLHKTVAYRKYVRLLHVVQ